MNRYDEEIIVFGAGQMRTGTTSLKLALEVLYNGKCYHMSEVFQNQKHIDLWQKSINNKKLLKYDAEEIFTGYCCAVDLPVAAFYEDLLEMYPSSKFILTTRNPDSWIKSVRETTFRIVDVPNFFGWIWYRVTGVYKFWKMIYSLYPMNFNQPLRELYDDAVLKECFLKHNASVISIIPKERLLIFEVREGWDPLCSFLGQTVPDVPFPNANNKDEFKETFVWIKRYLACKIMIKILIFSSVVGVVGWYVKHWL